MGGTQFHLQQGEAFLIKPGQVTYYQADEDEPWEYIWVAFGGEEAERLLKVCCLSREQYVCKLREFEAAAQYLKNLCASYEKTGHSKEALMGWLYLIFSLVDTGQEEEASSEMDYYQQARQYIQNNYGYAIKVGEIAKYVGIDRTYLYKIFKKYGDASPKKYLTAYRIRAARDFMGNTELNMTQIALSCGFQNSSVFCKNFYAEMGMSPTEYKKGLCEIAGK